MAPSIDAAGLRSLVKLIGQSVEVIISEYTKENTQVPSLDFIGVGPFDSPDKCTRELNDAVKILEGACAQLSVTCASPGHTMINVNIPLEFPHHFSDK
jgi:hypothetical protein